MARCVKIDCSEGDTWEALLEATLLEGWEADLINFDLDTHGQACARIAERRKVKFIPEPDKARATIRQVRRISH